MGRRQGGTEGSVREDPKGSGSWRARLPARLDPSRKAIPGSFSSATEARRALNEAIADIDRGRAVKPTQQRRQPTRRLAQVITEYTADRSNDGLDPIAVNTIRDYHELLKNVIGKGPDNLGLRPVKDIDSPLLNAWLRDLHRLGHSHARVTKAYALVRAALAWEVRQGRLAFNPAREVRRVSTKSGRGRRATVDPVLLPSWKELALLAAHPQRREDRLLILLMAWAGLRWSEAVGLSVTDVWPTRQRVSVRRVFTWSMNDGAWIIEEVKGGNADVVPVPTPLWSGLLDLAESRIVEDHLGGDLLFKPTRLGHGRKPTMTIDHTNWTQRVWRPARKAAGLDGDPNAPTLDPRRRPIKIKDLRAYAASVVVDSGGTPYEAAALLRHADVQTTNRYYARAQTEKSQDPARAALRISHDLTLAERIDALWVAWALTYPDETRHLFE